MKIQVTLTVPDGPTCDGCFHVKAGFCRIFYEYLNEQRVELDHLATKRDKSFTADKKSTRKATRTVCMKCHACCAKAGA